MEFPKESLQKLLYGKQEELPKESLNTVLKEPQEKIMKKSLEKFLKVSQYDYVRKNHYRNSWRTSWSNPWRNCWRILWWIPEKSFRRVLGAILGGFPLRILDGIREGISVRTFEQTPMNIQKGIAGEISEVIHEAIHKGILVESFVTILSDPNRILH